MNLATGDRELLFIRTFDAPRELVFQAWTDPKHFQHWFGPKGFTLTCHEMDMRPGGICLFTMHAATGETFPNRIRFDEVVKPERLRYQHSASESDPGRFDVDVHFKALSPRKTEMTMRATFATKEACDAVKPYAIDGNRETMDRLAAALPSIETGEPMPGGYRVTREFNAPRDLVWKCYSEAEHLANWWGPAGAGMRVAALDFRPGGVFHYAMKVGADEMFGKFVYREISKPERIVSVTSFSDANQGLQRHPGSKTWPIEMLSVAQFTEKNGKTTLTLDCYPINCGDAERKTFADGFSSMDQGFKGTLDKLAGYVGTLKR